MKTNLLSLLFFVFAFGNSFAQQIIILPNWNVGESKNLKITSINPREKEEDYDENTDYHVNEDKNSKNKA
jgi:hypothetical protein